MSTTSILILLVCIALMIYAVFSYSRIFIAQWRKNESFRPDGNELAKLQQKQENQHRFKMKEGFRNEDESTNK